MSGEEPLWQLCDADEGVRLAALWLDTADAEGR